MEKIDQAKKIIEEADAIIIGAGAGLSEAAGLTYSGERFEKNFKEFIEKYQMTDLYSAGFHPFDTQEEKWAFWSKHIHFSQYTDNGVQLYRDLLEVVKDKEYFVITTNVDSQFEKTGFEKEKIFEVQGNFGKFQCSTPCHNKVYNNKKQVFEMIEKQEDLKIPTELIPKCPKCGANMAMHLRIDNTFVETEQWEIQKERYYEFLNENKDKNIVFLELGVGFNTPTIIRFPFERFNNMLPKSNLIRVNKEESSSVDIISITSDMEEVFRTWKN